MTGSKKRSNRERDSTQARDLCDYEHTEDVLGVWPTTDEKKPFLADIDMHVRAPGDRPAWLQARRTDAADRFRALRFPSTHDEDWKYTNVAPILALPFQTTPAIASIDSALMAPFIYGDATVTRLVFVDGHFVGSLSNMASLQKVEIAISLGALPPNLDAAAQQFYSRLAGYEDQVFVALNTALAHDAALIFVPDGVLLEAPIYLLYLSTGNQNAVASQPRSLVVMGKRAEATVVETHAALGTGRTFSNGVTELVVGENASLEHYKVIRGDSSFYHVGTTQVRQERDSRFASFAITLGGQLVRNDLNVVLDAEGAECALNGLYATGNTEHVDNHTVIDHAQPHGMSRELYKGVLDGASRAVFNGKVLVRPGANQSDAQQTNRNLLLSSEARVDTKPQLEIFADDVRCTHGAAIGRLDEDSVFYLRSRAMDLATARRVLTYAFAGEVLRGMKAVPVRAALDGILAERFGGATIGEWARELDHRAG